MLLDLDLRLPLHVLGDARAADFPLDAPQEELESLPDVEALEDLVLVGDLEVEIGRGEIGEPAGIGDVHLEDRRHFIGDAFDQLGQCLGAGNDPRNEIVDLVRVGIDLLGGLDADDRVGLGLCDALDDYPSQTLEGYLDRLTGKIDALVDARRDADATDETLGIQDVVVVSGGDHEPHDQTRLIVGAKQREIFRGAHLHGYGAERVHDGRSQRHERQRGRKFSVQYVVFALGG